MQISFAVTAKLISAFLFATRIVQSIYFLNPKFQASCHLLWLCSPVCVGPGGNPRRPVFSQRGSDYFHYSTGCRELWLIESLFSTFKLSNIYYNLACVTEQADLCLTKSKDPKTGFLETRLIYEPRYEKTCLRGFQQGPTQSDCTIIEDGQRLEFSDF